MSLRRLIALSTVLATGAWLTAGIALAQRAPGGGQSQSSNYPSAQQGNGPAQNNPGMPGDQTSDQQAQPGQTSQPAAQPKVPDPQLQQDVQNAINADAKLKSAGITINVKKGKVELTGNVPDKATKKQAAKVAKSVTGVRGVKNRLQVVAGAAAGNAGATAGTSTQSSQSTSTEAGQAGTTAAPSETAPSTSPAEQTPATTSPGQQPPPNPTPGEQTNPQPGQQTPGTPATPPVAPTDQQQQGQQPPDQTQPQTQPQPPTASVTGAGTEVGPTSASSALPGTTAESRDTGGQPPSQAVERLKDKGEESQALSAEQQAAAQTPGTPTAQNAPGTTTPSSVNPEGKPSAAITPEQDNAPQSSADATPAASSSERARTTNGDMSQLRTRLMNELQSDPALSAVQVKVNGNRVTLSGTVASAADRKRAFNTVHQLAPDAQVRNRIRVQRTAKAPGTSQQ